MGSNEQQAILQYHPNQSLTGARISQKPSGQPALRRSISMTGMGSRSEGNKGQQGQHQREQPVSQSGHVEEWLTDKHGDPLPRRELALLWLATLVPFRVGGRWGG